MNKYIGKRFLQLIPVLLGITFLSFAMMRAAGSDAIIELYGDKGAVAQEIIDAKRAELGLDQPFLTQYGTWLRGLLTGNMGVSYVSGKDVFGTFVSKLPATLLLTALSIGATVIISIPLGIWAAVRHDKFTDYVLRFFSFIGNSLPNFFVALLLMQRLCVRDVLHLHVGLVGVPGAAAKPLQRHVHAVLHGPLRELPEILGHRFM